MQPYKQQDKQSLHYSISIHGY